MLRPGGNRSYRDMLYTSASGVLGMCIVQGTYPKLTGSDERGGTMITMLGIYRRLFVHRGEYQNKLHN